MNPKAPITPELKEAIINRFKEDDAPTLAELQVEFGVSKDTISRTLYEATGEDGRPLRVPETRGQKIRQSERDDVWRQLLSAKW